MVIVSSMILVGICFNYIFKVLVFNLIVKFIICSIILFTMLLITNVLLNIFLDIYVHKEFRVKKLLNGLKYMLPCLIISTVLMTILGISFYYIFSVLACNIKFKFIISFAILFTVLLVFDIINDFFICVD